MEIGQTAEGFLANSKGVLGTVTSTSLDTIILGTIFIVFFIYGYKYGKRKAIALILSFYLSIPLLTSFPYMDKLSFIGETEKAIAYSQIALFIVFTILLNIILGKVLSWELSSRGVRKFIETVLLSVVSVGVFTAISYHVIAITPIHNFSPQIDSVFASAQMFFLWLVIPFVIIVFTVRR